MYVYTFVLCLHAYTHTWMYECMSTCIHEQWSLSICFLYLEISEISILREVKIFWAAMVGDLLRSSLYFSLKSPTAVQTAIGGEVYWSVPEGCCDPSCEETGSHMDMRAQGSQRHVCFVMSKRTHWQNDFHQSQVTCFASRGNRKPCGENVLFRLSFWICVKLEQ